MSDMLTNPGQHWPQEVWKELMSDDGLDEFEDTEHALLALMLVNRGLPLTDDNFNMAHNALEGES